MKLHFISRSYAVPLGFQAARESCKVTAYLPDVPAGDGIVAKVPDAKPPAHTDAVLVDGAGWGNLVRDLVKDGHRVLFGGAWAELVGLKPDFNAKLLAKTGLPVAERSTLPYQLLVGGWYENEFRPPYYAAVLRERLLAGDVGAPSGLVAAEVAPLTLTSPLVMDWLEPLAAACDAVPYRGLLSLSLTPTPDGLTAVRVVAGIQPLIIEALCEMTHGGLTALLSGEVREDDTDCAVALSLSLPPWPYGLAPTEPEITFVLDEGQARHFWPLDLSGKDLRFAYAGAFGVLGTVTARGRPLSLAPEELGNDRAWFRQAGGRARLMASRLNVPMLQWRDDIGFRTLAAMDALAG